MPAYQNRTRARWLKKYLKELAEDVRNNYNKKPWLEVDGLLVGRKENPEHCLPTPHCFRKTIIYKT